MSTLALADQAFFTDASAWPLYSTSGLERRSKLSYCPIRPIYDNGLSPILIWIEIREQIYLYLEHWTQTHLQICGNHSSRLECMWSRFKICEMCTAILYDVDYRLEGERPYNVRQVRLSNRRMKPIYRIIYEHRSLTSISNLPHIVVHQKPDDTRAAVMFYLSESYRGEAR
jgi:hypothetical protein